MIVKFHRHGRGGGAGPVDYLLGKDRDREGARVLRGDPEQVRELIDTVHYAQRYKSAVLSFSENDIPDRVKRKLMDEFERTLLPGLDASQYSVLWVEHTDKGRIELNAVFPCVELQTGKRLQPYYDRIDRRRVDDWKKLINHEFGFSDPDDPARQRTLTMPPDLPRAVVERQRILHNGAMALIQSGSVSSRDELIAAFRTGGYEIARKTKNSISIKCPCGGKNIRLTGAIFGENFRSREGLGAEIAAASREYRENTEQRVSEIQKRYQTTIEQRSAANRKRYSRPPAAIERAAQQHSSLDDHATNNPNTRGRVGNVHHVAVRAATSGIPALRRLASASTNIRTTVQNEVKHEYDGIGAGIFKRIRVAAGAARTVAISIRERSVRIVETIRKIASDNDSTQKFRNTWEPLPDLQTQLPPPRQQRSGDRGRNLPTDESPTP